MLCVSRFYVQVLFAVFWTERVLLILFLSLTDYYLFLTKALVYSELVTYVEGFLLCYFTNIYALPIVNVYRLFFLYYYV